MLLGIRRGFIDCCQEIADSLRVSCNKIVTAYDAHTEPYRCFGHIAQLMHILKGRQLINECRANDPGCINIPLLQGNKSFIKPALSGQRYIAQRNALFLQIFIPQVRDKSAADEAQILALQVSRRLDIIPYVQLPGCSRLIGGLPCRSDNGIPALGYRVKHRKVRTVSDIHLLNEQGVYPLGRRSKGDDFCVNVMLLEKPLVRCHPEHRVGVGVGNFNV
ncbi:hypothetical protein D3C80_1292010 [compost metagenome]